MDGPLFDDVTDPTAIVFTPEDRRRFLAGIEAAADAGDDEARDRLRQVDELLRWSPFSLDLERNGVAPGDSR